MSTYVGQIYSELLQYNNWNSSWNVFFMRDGDDQVYAPSDLDQNYYFYGGNGNDTLIGSLGIDQVYGESGNDGLLGDYNNDWLYGGSGRDRLGGGRDDDHLLGGTQSDELSGDYSFGPGNAGRDYFIIRRGDSWSSNAGADHIMDWSTADDHIDMPYRGTIRNYHEHSTNRSSIDSAKTLVRDYADSNDTYVFLYNSSKDVGFLFADLDRKGGFETAVVLEHQGSAWNFHWQDIV